MVRKFIPVLALIFLAASLAAAQDLALKGGTLLTLTGSTIENGTILVQGGKITAIGRDVSIPSGIQVIDVGGNAGMVGAVDRLVYGQRPFIRRTGSSIVAHTVQVVAQVVPQRSGPLQPGFLRGGSHYLHVRAQGNKAGRQISLEDLLRERRQAIGQGR